MIRSQQERLVDIITRRHLLLQNLNAFIDEWHQSSIHYEPSLIGGLDHSLPQRLYKRRRGLDGILRRALSLISSTSFIVGTGLKKCNPRTFSGRFVADAILLILIDEVFEARIVFLGQTLSKVEKTCSLIPVSSKTASTTRSALLHAFAKATLPCTFA